MAKRVSSGKRGGGRPHANGRSLPTNSKKVASHKVKRRNPVAKFGRKLNKGGAHRDRTKYWRKEQWQKDDE